VTVCHAALVSGTVSAVWVGLVGDEHDQEPAAVTTASIRTNRVERVYRFAERRDN